MFDSSKITFEFLEGKRQIADPLADRTVTKIIEAGLEERINEVFYTLTRNEGYTPALFNQFPKEIQEAIDHYFQESGKLPEWFDETLIRQGEEVFGLYGPEVFMLLNVKSLPMCYTCAKGSKVLYDTGRLVEHHGQIDPLVRRLMETAQMVINVLQPGGLSATGNGIVTMQKVRLIHASIRQFLKSKKFNPAGWDVEELGEPINQEDLAGTLMSFSPVILSGLKTLKIQLTDEQIKAYTHCWKVVGHVMGLDSDLLADSYEDNWDMACKILQHQAAASPEGKALTDSCVAFIQHMIPGTLFDKVPEYMIWYFFQDVEKATGKPLAEMIGISNHCNLEDHLMIRLSEIITGDISRSEHHEIVQIITAKMNHELLNGFVKHFNDGKRVRFFIPPSLKGSWGLTG